MSAEDFLRSNFRFMKKHKESVFHAQYMGFFYPITTIVPQKKQYVNRYKYFFTIYQKKELLKEFFMYFYLKMSTPLPKKLF